MGLDQYLYGIRKNITDSLDPDSGSFVEAAYWRKANQVHKFFSDKFIKDNNPWGYYEVEEGDIQELLLICKLIKFIKENPSDDLFGLIKTDYIKLIEEVEDEMDYNVGDYVANILLPPDNLGCFFGSGFVDDWYWAQIDETIEQLTKVLEQNFDKMFYMASW